MATYTLSYDQTETFWTDDGYEGWVSNTVTTSGPVIGPFSSATNGGPNDVIWDDWVGAGDTVVGVISGYVGEDGYSSSVSFIVYGSSQDVTIEDSGFEYVESGGVASGTIVGLDSLLYLVRGGSAYNTIVGSNGSMCVDSGCSAYDTTVVDGGELILDYGFDADPATISAATSVGVAYGLSLSNYTIVEDWSVESGGSVSQMTLSSVSGSDSVSFGELSVYQGGSASDILLTSGTEADVIGGQINNCVMSQTYLQVSGSDGDLGVCSDAKVYGGTIFVEKNGLISGVVLNAVPIFGGEGGVFVYGGSATNITVNSDCEEWLSGGVATDTNISGGEQLIFSGALAISTTIIGGLGGTTSVGPKTTTARR